MTILLRKLGLAPVWPCVHYAEKASVVGGWFDLAPTFPCSGHRIVFEQCTPTRIAMHSSRYCHNHVPLFMPCSFSLPLGWECLQKVTSAQL